MYISTARGFGEITSCSSTNCSAVSLDPFRKQPPDLRSVLARSFKNPAQWFENLDRERRMALTSIFNRMCQHRLWCHVQRVIKVAPGERPVLIADRVFNVPGSTPSVYFVSLGGKALIQALMATGRFCLARGIGASQHPGQTTIREISGSDSLHVSVGPGDQFDAHIDKFSPVTDPPGSSFCSNRPSGAALTHIGREVVPGPVRKKTRIPGVQVFPEPPPPGPQADLTRRQDDSPPLIVGVTGHGPVKRRKPRAPAPADPALSANVVRQIDRDVKKRVRRDALLPPELRARLAKARWAAETAGPREETALRRAREAVQQEAGNYPDAHEFALGLAERMEQARRRGVAWVKLSLTQFGPRDFGGRKAVAAQIRRIALIIRNHLPGNAQNVRTIVIVFGSGNFATREEVKLP